MGNAVGSFFSGVGTALGNLFGSPIDFISGKSCSSICGATWDFICYIENFCLANLMKLAMVFFLSYVVLLFIYLLYKLGIVHCISHSLCKMIWACFASCFYTIECCCSFLWFKVLLTKRVDRRRRKRDVEEYDFSSEDDDSRSFSYPTHRDLRRFSSTSSGWRENRKKHLRNSLRPRNHRVRVGIGRDLGNYGYRRRPSRRASHLSAIHGIRVTRTSKFAHRGNGSRRNHYPRRLHW